MEDANEHTKEVYARFGLAVYFSQVLEHEIVNALTMLELIPRQRPAPLTIEAWRAEFQSFLEQKFEKTLGRLISNLKLVTQISQDLEASLQESLRKRNWLAHGFFRDCAEDFFTQEGRAKMIGELRECHGCFENTRTLLDEIIRPIRNEYGYTDEMVKQELDLIINRKP